tara:strand:- start:167 stop:454 length:288 start_codon:yes stop_codon:yes gene_type:complete
MKRYKHNKVKRDSTGSRYRETTIYPGNIERNEDDLYIYIQAGIRLDNLAFKYYKDTTLWWVIALANNLGKGTFFVPPGTRLRIPSKTSEYIQNLR